METWHWLVSCVVAFFSGSSATAHHQYCHKHHVRHLNAMFVHLLDSLDNGNFQCFDPIFAGECELFDMIPNPEKSNLIWGLPGLGWKAGAAPARRILGGMARMSKGLKRSSISPPCMSPPIIRKPTVSCGICRVRHLIVDSPILSQGIDT